MSKCVLFIQSAFCLLLSGDLSPFMGERERLRLLLCLLPDRDLDLSPRERSRLDLSLKQKREARLGVRFAFLSTNDYFSCAKYFDRREQSRKLIDRNSL